MSESSVYAQFGTALRFALKEQTRNRLAGALLVGFVPAWYGLMVAIVPHKPLTFRLYATGQILHIDGRHLSLITAGLNVLTLIVGFAVFAAVRRALTFDRRLAAAGYRRATLLAAKSITVAAVAMSVAAYTTGVMLAFWRPGPGAVGSIALAFAVIAFEYGALGLLLGVTVRGDLEGFFLIIMASLLDTFLQNPLGNPVANKPVLEYFPSFGPMQFATGGSAGHSGLFRYLLLGLGWATAFAVLALILFTARTRTTARVVVRP